MIPISKLVIDAIIKNPDSKSNSGKDNPILYQNHSASLTNMIDLIRNFSEYEMGQLINNNEHWIRCRGVQITTKYKRGDIVIADLGAHNFKNEPSYPHPCIVLKNAYDSLLVIPCSSKKYGKGFEEIIDATSADGFMINTGIQTTSYRWISKNRVISRMGTLIGNRVLNEVDNKMLSHIPSHRLIVKKKEVEINDLMQKLASANAKIEKLSELNKNKDEEIRVAQEKLLALQEAAITKEPS